MSDARACPTCGAAMEPVPDAGFICPVPHPDVAANPGKVVAVLTVTMHETGFTVVNGHQGASDVAVQALARALHVAKKVHAALARKAAATWN